MAELYLLRHYPTDWNHARRIQGHTDIPLAADSIDCLTDIDLSPQLRRWQWFSSPLLRAKQTADALGINTLRVSILLGEMHWGEFEGVTIREIEKLIPQHDIQPDTGLDFRPPGGESPREVCARFLSWLPQINNMNSVAVTHKGVIRAALSLATGWDMEAPFDPVQAGLDSSPIDWSQPFHFSVSPAGTLSLKRINASLITPPAS